MGVPLKPVKGWKIRVIVCDEKGRYEFDDVMRPEQIPAIAERLIYLLDRQVKISGQTAHTSE